MPEDNLIGTRVALTSRRDPADRWAGVLLPPATGSAELRVHTHSGLVVAVDGDWLISRETPPDTKSRRLTHCPAGRPLYRHGDLPTVQLATVTMLKRARLQPADGQDPLASYMVMSGKHYAPLYAIVDTAAMPTLSPARQANRDAARTCAACGIKTRDRFAPPFAQARDNKRYCEDCQEGAAKTWWEAYRYPARCAAAEWAREILADTDVLLFHYHSWWGLAVETLDGAPVIAPTRTTRNLRWIHLPTGGLPDGMSEEAYRAQFVALADLAEPIRALQGRRLISAHGSYAGIDYLNRDMTGLTDDPITLTDRPGDAFGRRFGDWRAELDQRGSSGYRHNTNLKRHDLPDDPAECLNTIRQGLHQMAAWRP